MSNKDQVIDLSKRLIETASPNPPGKEQACVQVAIDFFRDHGIKVVTQLVAPDRFNLIATLCGDGTRPGLLFNGHFDTVPPGKSGWPRNPWGAVIEGGKLYGLGSADMKGALAVMMSTLAVVKKKGIPLKGNLVFAGTVGEEADKCGAIKLCEWDGWENLGSIIIGEPTANKLVIAHRGALWLRLTTKGKTAHGSLPHLGVNAIDRMIRALAALEKHRFHFAPHRLLDPPTLNVGTIRGGIKINVVPDYCEAEVDIRLVPGQMPERVTGEVREVINRGLGEEPFFSADKAPDNQAQIGIEVVCTAEPVQTSPSKQVVIQAQEVAREVFGGSAELGGAPYFTDGSVIQPKTGKPVLIVGPGEESQAHHPNEYVYLEDLAKAATFYEALALRLLC